MQNSTSNASAKVEDDKTNPSKATAFMSEKFIHRTLRPRVPTIGHGYYVQLTQNGAILLCSSVKDHAEFHSPIVGSATTRPATSTRASSRKRLVIPTHRALQAIPTPPMTKDRSSPPPLRQQPRSQTPPPGWKCQEGVDVYVSVKHIVASIQKKQPPSKDKNANNLRIGNKAVPGRAKQERPSASTHVPRLVKIWEEGSVSQPPEKSLRHSKDGVAVSATPKKSGKATKNNKQGNTEKESRRRKLARYREQQKIQKKHLERKRQNQAPKREMEAFEDESIVSLSSLGGTPLSPLPTSFMDSELAESSQSKSAASRRSSSLSTASLSSDTESSEEDILQIFSKKIRPLSSESAALLRNAVSTSNNTTAKKSSKKSSRQLSSQRHQQTKPPQLTPSVDANFVGPTRTNTPAKTSPEGRPGTLEPPTRQLKNESATLMRNTTNTPKIDQVKMAAPEKSSLAAVTNAALHQRSVDRARISDRTSKRTGHKPPRKELVTDKEVSSSPTLREAKLRRRRIANWQSRSERRQKLSLSLYPKLNSITQNNSDRETRVFEDDKSHSSCSWGDTTSTSFSSSFVDSDFFGLTPHQDNAPLVDTGISRLTGMNTLAKASPGGLAGKWMGSPPTHIESDSVGLLGNTLKAQHQENLLTQGKPTPKKVRFSLLHPSSVGSLRKQDNVLSRTRLDHLKDVFSSTSSRRRRSRGYTGQSGLLR